MKKTGSSRYTNPPAPGRFQDLQDLVTPAALDIVVIWLVDFSIPFDSAVSRSTRCNSLHRPSWEAGQCSKMFCHANATSARHYAKGQGRTLRDATINYTRPRGGSEWFLFIKPNFSPASRVCCCTKNRAGPGHSARSHARPVSYRKSRRPPSRPKRS